MTDMPIQDGWFLDDMTPEEFEKLSGEERLRKIMQHELKDLYGDGFKARVEEISKRADEFVKKLRLSRVKKK